MNRRSFLGLTSLTTLSLSGCISEDEDRADTTSDGTTTPESTAITTGPPSTTTETMTTTPENDATEKILRARSLLEDAIRLYASAGGEQNASIVDVDATTSSFPRRDIERKVYAANRALSDADSTATDGQRQTITTLKRVGQFVVRAASAQGAVIRAYNGANRAKDALYETRWPNVKSYGRMARTSGLRGEHYVDRATQDSSPESVTAVSGVTPSEYTAEVTQLKGQANALRAIGEQFLRVEDGIWKYRDAVPQYTDETYSRAADNFAAATDAFSSVETAIENQDHKNPVASTYADLNCVSGGLAGATEHMQKAAVAAQNDDRETQEEEEDKAATEFHSCDVLEEILVWVL